MSANETRRAAKLIRKASRPRKIPLEDTILLLDQALRLLRKPNRPREFKLKVEVLTRLGEAHLSGQSNSPAENIERAIRCCKAALRLAHKHNLSMPGSDPVFSHGTDRIRAWLAVAYDRRVVGSREENVQKVLVYSDSLFLEGPEDTELRGLARLARAKAFRDRYSDSSLGVGAESHIAIAFFDDALRCLRKRKSPEYWAEVHLELGKTLLTIADDERDSEWRKARGHLRKAATVFQRKTHALKYGVVHAELGKYYARKARETKARNLRDKARSHYQRSLRSLTAAGNPKEWAEVHTELAKLAFKAFNAPARGEAAWHLQRALTALTAEGHEADRIEVLHHLGRLHFFARSWLTAVGPLSEALELARRRLSRSYTLGGRRTVVRDVSSLANCLAYCQYRAGRLNEAMITIESGKALLLSETLCWSDVDHQDLTLSDRSQLRTTRAKIKSLEATEYGGMSWIEDSDRLEAVRKRFNRLLERTASTRPEWPGRLSSISEMSPIESGSALVAALITPMGGALFILFRGDDCVTPENVIDLPELTTTAVDASLVLGSDLVRGWIPTYQQRNSGVTENERWRATMLSACEELWEKVVGRLWKRLKERDVHSVSFLLSSGLQFLPLHAAVCREPGRLHYFIDECTVNYVPSAYVMRISRQRGSDRTFEGSFLVAGVTHYDDLPPLPHVREEIEMVATVLSAVPLLDKQATRKSMLSRMSDTAVVHIASHGVAWALGGQSFRMQWSPPSILHLSGDGLTFQDIVSRDLTKARLVCLSACDTGMIDFTLPWDEFEGLANAFLQAGAAAVVSSLWAADDRSTPLLMHRFYWNIVRCGLAPSDALREAQIWLRDGTRASLASAYEQMIKNGMHSLVDAYTELTLGGVPEERPYGHPYYWAPFVLTGV